VNNACVYSDETGNSNHVEALSVYLLSRSLSRLKDQFEARNGMVSSQCRILFPFSESVFLGGLVLIACLHSSRLQSTASKVIHQLIYS